MEREGTTEVYAISEVFDSIQGEGFWTGTRMAFIRMAGCSVGRPIRGEEPYEQCETYDGRTFMCDTNYKLRENMSVSNLQLFVPIEVNHVCITGGEPLTRNLMPLIHALVAREKRIHIETSGTVIPDWWQNLSELEDAIWLTVSPKLWAKDEMIEMADEIKILVDKNFDLAKVPQSVMNHKRVYVQPINHVSDLNHTSMHRAIEVVMKERPTWKMSTQLHKVWELR